MPSFHKIYYSLLLVAGFFIVVQYFHYYYGSSNDKSSLLLTVNSDSKQPGQIQFASDGNDDEDQLTEQQLDRSILHFGDQSRFQHHLMQLFMSSSSDNNKLLRLGVIGGSNTEENHIQRTGSMFYDYPLKWLRKTFEGKFNISFTNAAIAATNSEFSAFCIQEIIDLPKIDILLIEFAINDAIPAPYMFNHKPRGRPMEELIRAIWRVNQNVDIILVNMARIPVIFNKSRDSVNCDWIDDQDYLKLARHYRLGSIQWKHLYCNEKKVPAGDLEKLFKKYAASDGRHCNHIVHRHLGKFLVHYFQKAVKDFYDNLLRHGEFTEPERIFETTWIDGSDCFMDKRLENALLVPTRYHFSDLKPPPPQCEGSYALRLSFVYLTCASCYENDGKCELSIDVSSGVSYQQTYNVTLAKCPLNHFIVHPLLQSTNCQADQVDYLDVTVKVLSMKDYPYPGLKAFIIGYDCCAN